MTLAEMIGMVREEYAAHAVTRAPVRWRQIEGAPRRRWILEVIVPGAGDQELVGDCNRCGGRGSRCEECGRGALAWHEGDACGTPGCGGRLEICDGCAGDGVRELAAMEAGDQLDLYGGIWP